MFCAYLSHPEVVIDPDVPVPDWGLTEKGRMRTIALAKRPWLSRIGRIVSSDEEKARQTAAICAEAVGLAVEVVPETHENDRSATGFIPPTDFEAAANAFFASPLESYRGWERAIDAQARIVAAVERILANHDARTPVLIVGHGGVGTLLKCHVAGHPISRVHDQRGAGNIYAFSLAERRLLCDWTPMDDFEGLAGWT